MPKEAVRKAAEMFLEGMRESADLVGWPLVLAGTAWALGYLQTLHGVDESGIMRAYEDGQRSG